jgi:hypothetical protein
MPRYLRPEELELVFFIAAAARIACSREELAKKLVEESGDRGHGGVTFLRDNSHDRTTDSRGGATLVGDYQSADEDGIPVIFSLRLDGQGNLYEFDFWKVDFSKIRRYPSPRELTVVDWKTLPDRR